MGALSGWKRDSACLLTLADELRGPGSHRAGLLDQLLRAINGLLSDAAEMEELPPLSAHVGTDEDWL